MNREKVMENKIRTMPQVALFEDTDLIVAEKHKETLLKFIMHILKF